MAKIFISYRRADSATISGRIYDHLDRRFGEKNIFMDVDDIPPGVNFGSYIQKSLKQCAVALIVIGPRWLDQEADNGGRRLDNATDWVRIEVETAFSLGLTVIPILVDNTQMPKAADLPVSLQELTQINSISVRDDPDFARDMNRLIAAIESAFAARRSFGILRRGTPVQARQDASISPPGAGKEAAAPGAGNIKRGQELARNWRPLVIILAVMLLVTSLIGVHFFTGFPNVGAGSNTSASQTPNANASATTSARMTATSDAFAFFATVTASVVRFPYVAPAPGPGCDAGVALWTANTGVGVTCASNPTRTHLVNTCPSLNVCGPGVFITTGAYFTLSRSYTVSVDVSGVSAVDAAGLPQAVLSVMSSGQAASTTTSYNVGLRSDGSYYMCHVGIPGVSCTELGQGSVNAGTKTRLALLVSGSSVSGSVNGRVFATVPDAYIATNSQTALIISVYGHSGAHADFANFTITQP